MAEVNDIKFVDVDPVVANEKGIKFAKDQAVELTRARFGDKKDKKVTEQKEERLTSKEE